MKILFMSLIDFETIEERNIYTDLLREFWKNGHDLYVISPYEKRKALEPRIFKSERVTVIKPVIGNMQKNGPIEKGISTLTLEKLLIKAIKQYLPDIRFDLVLYPTPPITFQKVVEYVKKKDGAVAYLLLKDIFPDNTVEVGMLSKSGLKGLIYKYFKRKEKKLYKTSDFIGCMSQANVDYLRLHNPDLEIDKIEICPNCIDPLDKSVSTEQRMMIRKKYDIPLDKRVFVYGGNLGIAQCVDYIIECIKSQRDNENCYFLIVGDGTHYEILEKYFKEDNPPNAKIMKRLPKDDYDTMLGACDVGLIFLDHRFTIPNFPSRLLSYMQAKIPILACTDPCTDIGKAIIDGGFGWWCESNSVEKFNDLMKSCNNSRLAEMGEKGYKYLLNDYSSERGYRIIMEHFNK